MAKWLFKSYYFVVISLRAKVFHSLMNIIPGSVIRIKPSDVILIFVEQIAVYLLVAIEE